MPKDGGDYTLHTAIFEARGQERAAALSLGADIAGKEVDPSRLQRLGKLMADSVITSVYSVDLNGVGSAPRGAAITPTGVLRHQQDSYDPLLNEVVRVMSLDGQRTLLGEKLQQARGV